MMKNIHSTLLLFMAFIVLGLLGAFRNEPQTGNVNAKVNFDSTGFIANTTGGWVSFSSYFTPIGADSMEMEFLISHGNPLDWKSRQYIGMINGSSVVPKDDQKITYALLPDNIWSVEIQPNGNCFLTQLSGNTPAGNPVVLPIKIRYRIKS